KKGWRSVVGFVARSMLHVRGLVDPTFNVQGAIRQAKQQQTQDFARYDRQQQMTPQQREQKLQKQLADIWEGRAEAIKKIDAQQQKSEQARSQAAQNRVNAAVDALKQAKQAYQAALDKAKKEQRNPGKGGAGDEGAPKPPKLDDLIDGLQQGLHHAAAKLD